MFDWEVGTLMQYFQLKPDISPLCTLWQSGTIAASSEPRNGLKRVSKIFEKYVRVAI